MSTIQPQRQSIHTPHNHKGNVMNTIQPPQYKNNGRVHTHHNGKVMSTMQPQRQSTYAPHNHTGNVKNTIQPQRQSTHAPHNHNGKVINTIHINTQRWYNYISLPKQPRITNLAQSVMHVVKLINWTNEHGWRNIQLIGNTDSPFVLVGICWHNLLNEHS